MSEESLSRALLALLERAKMVVEPAGAAAVAAMLDDPTAYGGPAVAVLSGGNIDPLLLGKVIRHGMASAGRYLYLRVCIPDVPGGLARLLTELGEAGANILEVAHERISRRPRARRGRGADPDGDPRRAARRAGRRAAARVRLPHLRVTGARHSGNGTASTISICRVLPLGASNSTVAPFGAPTIAAPSGDCGENDLDPVVVVLDLAGAQQELLGLVVADEAVGDDLARRDHAVVVGRVGDGDLEHLLELEDPGLDLALLVLGGVVAAVLLQVTLVAGSTDPLDDLLALGTAQVLELGRESRSNVFLVSQTEVGWADCVMGASTSCVKQSKTRRALPSASGSLRGVRPSL